MKSASLILIVMFAIAFAQHAKADSTFDGNWSVTLNTPAYKDPTGLEGP